MSNRLYENYGATKKQFEVAKVIDSRIKSLSEELVIIMKEYDIDPRDFKTYCLETMDLNFCEIFVKLGVETRRK